MLERLKRQEKIQKKYKGLFKKKLDHFTYYYDGGMGYKYKKNGMLLRLYKLHDNMYEYLYNEPKKDYKECVIRPKYIYVNCDE